LVRRRLFLNNRLCLFAQTIVQTQLHVPPGKYDCQEDSSPPRRVAPLILRALLRLPLGSSIPRKMVACPPEITHKTGMARRFAKTR
jgi:hypothetical protein